jgi:hypothetical protein
MNNRNGKLPGNGIQLFNMTRMAVILIASILITQHALVAGQSPLATDEEIGLFMNSTTCLVLEDGDVSYNILMKDAVENFWEITDFEVIDKEEFKERRLDSKYSFLVLVKSSYDEDPEGVEYNFLNLLLGRNTAEMEDMPELASIPLSYTSDAEVGYAYAIPSIIQFLQRHVRTLKSKRTRIKMCGLNYYNRSRKFKDKALLLREDHMAPEISKVSEIKDVYPYYVMLLTADEMAEELEGDKPNVLFLHHVGPESNDAAGQCFEMIFTQNGELYYNNSREVTNIDSDGFTKRDLRKIRF